MEGPAGTSSNSYEDAFIVLFGFITAVAMNFVVLTVAISTIGMSANAISWVFLSISRDGYFPGIFNSDEMIKRPSVWLLLKKQSLYRGM
jgi:amino acid transporter